MKKLYKQDSTGKVREWTIDTLSNTYTIRHGVSGGKMQEKVTICKAKNVGRANETSPMEQAILEAEAKYKAQMERECYVVKIGDKPHHLQPQLCLDAAKVPKRVPWDNDLLGSPKMDGVRAIWVNGQLQSRKGVAYNVPHIQEQLIKADVTDNLDGELYLHGQPLGKILGACRKVQDLTHELEFHVFDVATPDIKYGERIVHIPQNIDAVHLVPQTQVTFDNHIALHNQFVKQGYEGLILRDTSAVYGFGERNPSLFKYKCFQEADFVIIDIQPDKDGQAVITYHSPDGEFKSRPRGTNAYREQLVENAGDYLGLEGTVRFFDYTHLGIPQFPVTVAIGDDK